MPELQIVLDDAAAGALTTEARYTVELTRSLVAAAPTGCAVHGITALRSEHELDSLAALIELPVRIDSLPLGRRELTIAWQMGAKLPALDGMIHSPSMLAPLRKHERHGGNQVVVTIHDTAAWAGTQHSTAAEEFWNKRLLKRVRKFADAVVVPTHAVANSLAAVVDLGDRVRVISPAVARDLAPGADAEDRARILRLPERYVVIVGDTEPRRGMAVFFHAMRSAALAALPIVVVTPALRTAALHELMLQVGVPEHRVTVLSDLAWPEYSLVIARAAMLVAPSLDSGFGLPVVEAFKLGTPVVHSDAPALLEVAGGAGQPVERQQHGYPERLAEAVRGVLDDDALAARLRVLGEDRAKAYSWHDTASRVWQLHADL